MQMEFAQAPQFMSPEQRLLWLQGQLRQPLPTDFQWDYLQLSTCALGLYGRHTGTDSRSLTSRHFGVSAETFMNIFYTVGGTARATTTPAEVADYIDRALARQQRYGRFFAASYETIRFFTVGIAVVATILSRKMMRMIGIRSVRPPQLIPHEV